MKKTNKLKTKQTRLILGKRDISIFEKLPNRRDLRKSTIKKLRLLLEQGNHFDTPLMANRKEGRFRLLDGNHRLEAIELYLTKHPNREVEISLFYYEGLGLEEEREI